jgi:hypothetical protein
MKRTVFYSDLGHKTPQYTIKNSNSSSSSKLVFPRGVIAGSNIMALIEDVGQIIMNSQKEYISYLLEDRNTKQTERFDLHLDIGNNT